MKYVKDAIRMGKEAREYGRTKECNPFETVFKRQMRLHEAWDDGWDAMDERLKEKA